MTESVFLTRNAFVDRSNAYPESARSVISNERALSARAELRVTRGYAVTPLHSFHRFATASSLASIWLKDEGARFGLSSFKSLGAALAVRRLKTAYADRGRLTIACAVEGNFGRAVAREARQHDVRCVVYVDRTTSAAREAELHKLGAKTVRVNGAIDESLQALQRDAEHGEWHVVSTAGVERAEAGESVLAGYGTAVLEIFEQLGNAPPPTHVFVPGGSGGFAASICGMLWERYGARRPRLIVVEPLAADCISRSIAAGKRTRVAESDQTVMAELAYAIPSSIAWNVLQCGIDFAMTIADERAVCAMRNLAFGAFGASPIILGASGASGFAAMTAILGQREFRDQLELDAGARILILGTEGAADVAQWESQLGFSLNSLRKERNR